jgi:hypothetical protein
MFDRSNDDGEEDVVDDSKVAGSRAGKHDGDDEGSYVGVSGSDDSFDAGLSGAEARAQAK